ncbi:MAG: DUF4082 domain-containing protein, partial [Candidatus Cloacimonetes bacterium]|nr:DUF4082 domain-containing protein [Candidatus Cloacimonadota bacterium]
AGIQNLDGITLGANHGLTQNSDTEIMEVIVYNADISDRDRDVLTGYLAKKWKIPATTDFKGYIIRHTEAPTINGAIGTSIENTTTVDCGVEKLWHSKFETTDAGTISYGHIYIDDGNNAKMCISIHSSDGTCIGSGESADIGDNTAEWINIELNSPVDITASTNYYLGFQVDAEIYIKRHYIEGVTGYRYSDNSYTYNCGGNVNAEESTGTGSEREIVILFNNTAGDPE